MTGNFILSFHLEATSQKSMNNVFNKIKNKLEKEFNLIIVNIDDNQFYVEKIFDDWKQCVYEMIVLSQRLGREWIINGIIQHEICLWTNKPNIVGVKCIEINCENKSCMK
jgi:hypothetical protein